MSQMESNNKPDWKDAPEWANFLAMDRDGLWYWFENKPMALYSAQEWVTSGNFKMAYTPPEWDDSLEERPK